MSGKTGKIIPEASEVANRDRSEQARWQMDNKTFTEELTAEEFAIHI